MTERRETLREQLLGWYHTRRRRLPWRENPTPYRVWVAEIMLQQTRVETVLPYYERFLSAFPDVTALARASEEDVLGLWAGLGYYRRARHLHAAARKVVEAYGGRLPQSARELRELPGIGPYTAAAIASVAFGERAAVLDGNVERVLSRLLALDEPVDAAAGKRRLREEAEALVDPDDPSSHNQAMMELGATVCTSRAPACLLCPIRSHCAARAEGAPERYPIKRPRTQPKPVLGAAGLVRDEAGRVLVARRPSDALLGGLWELPGGEVPKRGSRRRSLSRVLRDELGLHARVGRHLATVRHTFSHRRLTLEIYRVDEASGRPEPGWYTACRWLPPDELRELPLSRLAGKVLDALAL